MLIFEKLSRRSFLKSSAFVAMSSFLLDGCSSGRLPSDYDDTVPFSDEEIQKLKKVNKIIVDSEVLSTARPYDPLPALGSDDAIVFRGTVK